MGIRLLVPSAESLIAKDPSADMTIKICKEMPIELLYTIPRSSYFN